MVSILTITIAELFIRAATTERLEAIRAGGVHAGEV